MEQGKRVHFAKLILLWLVYLPLGMYLIPWCGLFLGWPFNSDDVGLPTWFEVMSNTIPLVRQEGLTPSIAIYLAIDLGILGLLFFPALYLGALLRSRKAYRAGRGFWSILWPAIFPLLPVLGATLSIMALLSALRFD